MCDQTLSFVLLFWGVGGSDSPQMLVEQCAPTYPSSIVSRNTPLHLDWGCSYCLKVL